MPCNGLSRGPAIWSTWDSRDSNPWEVFRVFKDALAPVLKVSEIGAENRLFRRKLATCERPEYSGLALETVPEGTKRGPAYSARFVE